MAYVYYITDGLTERDAWDKALSQIIFTPDQLINKVEQNVADEVMDKVICIDDAAVHFSGYLYFINIYQTAYLQGLFDTIGTITNAIILTCPKKKRLMTGLKNYDDYDIQIVKFHDWERVARGIKWYTMPDGRQRYRKMWEDQYSCYLPDWVFDKYMIQRNLYLKQISKKLQELRVDLEKRKKHGIHIPDEVLELDGEVFPDES
jgi:hypothetical protein